MLIVPVFFPSVPLAVCLCALFVAAGCYPEGTTPATIAEILDEGRPVQESWGARFDVQEGERPRVHIIAGYMARIETPDSTYLLLRSAEAAPQERVTAYLFDEAGDSSAVLVADILHYYEEERRFESRGNVIVDTFDDKRLETEHLLWYEADRKVRTSGFVRITTPREHIQGYELDAEEDLEHYSLARVTGQVLVEEQ